MKKLINRPQDVVAESLAGLAEAHSDLIRLCENPLYVVRKDAPVSGKVGILSGGGSGHEPLHAGYVGRGMLDAACPGDVFTSPTPDQIEAATKAVNACAGVLHIIKNYTGDVMNFEMAAELCQPEGIEVETVLIDDDVAVKDSLYTAGRRGVGATVLVEKICGAAAERGDKLSAVASVGREVNQKARSIGMALTSCTVPAAGKPTFEISDNEMEFGIGIHGEPGRSRMEIKPAGELVRMMTEEIINDLPLRSGDSVIALVNGMGGTPLMEVYLVFYEVTRVCRDTGLKIARQLVGNYITSLDMAGCSITLLKADARFLDLWDAPVLTPALRWGF